MKKANPLYLTIVLVASLMICPAGFAAKEIKIGVIQAQSGMYAGFGTGE
jgi:hypothetical protein